MQTKKYSFWNCEHFCNNKISWCVSYCLERTPVRHTVRQKISNLLHFKILCLPFFMYEVCSVYFLYFAHYFQLRILPNLTFWMPAQENPIPSTGLMPLHENFTRLVKYSRSHLWYKWDFPAMFGKVRIFFRGSFWNLKQEQKINFMWCYIRQIVFILTQ